MTRSSSTRGPAPKCGPGRLGVLAVTAVLLSAPLAMSGSVAPATASVASTAAATGSSVDVAWGDRSLQVRQVTTVTGSVVPAEAGRPVVVERASGGGSWRPVSALTSTGDEGVFSVRVTHSAVGTFAYRVRAKATETDPADVISTPVTVTVDRATTKISSRLSKGRVPVGGKTYLSGSVNPAWGGRTIVLQRKVPGRWVKAAPPIRVKDDAYRFRVPTRWYGAIAYRTVVAGTGLTTAASSPTRVLRVTPTYRPAGRASQHSFFGAPRPRWNPCTSVRYRVNTRHTTRGALADTKRAVREVEKATGLNFVYRGRTRKIPSGSTTERFPAGTDFVIAWARPRQSRMLASSPTAAGVGGPLYYPGFSNGDGSSTSWITRGKVVLNAVYKFKPGFGRGYTRGELLMHEITHAVGIDHTFSRSQVMFPVMQPGLARFGAGDLAGLSKVGASRGCVFSGDDSMGRFSSMPRSVFRAAVPVSRME